jgi:KDO2-lipid IV(A) lauroyltransferase
MSKPRSRAADFAVYLVVRCFVCVVQALSWNAAHRLAAGLATLAYHLDRRHRTVADDNLRHAFPYLDDRSRDRQVRAVFRHFITLVIEIIQLTRKMHVTNWCSHLELVGGGRLMDHFLSNRPVLLVTGHLGNWELGGYAIGLLGFRSFAVARPLDNPFLDAYLHRFRESTGQEILTKHGDLGRMRTILTSGGIIATLGDQDAGQRGLFVDFFGRPASTHKAIALLALEHHVPMAVIGICKVGERLRYQLLVEDVIFPEEYDGQPAAVKAITQRFTSALERLVRQAPEQYFWLHRRWKHQPAKARRRAA